MLLGGEDSAKGRQRLAQVAYVSKRVGIVLLSFWFIISLLFLLPYLAPGDPVTYKFRTGGTSLTTEQYAAMRSQLGLDEPLSSQYLSYLARLIRGDMGESFTYQRPVLEIIVDRIPATAILMVSAIAIGLVGGTILGIRSARKPNSREDSAVQIGSLIGYSLPQFWLGVMVLQLFAVRLGWFPSTGMVNPTLEAGTLEYYRDILYHAVLPVFSLTLFYIALFARYARTSMLEEATENYVVTARAKGLSASQAFRRHVVRNGLLPILTMIGIALSYIFGGAVLIETVFSWPGIGLLLFNAILARDYPLIQGVFFFAAVTIIATNLVTDVVYGYVDPRTRLERRA